MTDWQGLYSELLHSLQPGVGYPADYDYAAEHEANIVKAREHSALDATIERDQLKTTLESIDRKFALRNKAKVGPLTEDEVEELENSRGLSEAPKSERIDGLEIMVETLTTKVSLLDSMLRDTTGLA